MNMNIKMLDLDSIRHEQIKAILKHYGEDHQRVKAVEELAELQCEILHHAAYQIVDDTALYDSMTEEVADVYIMLEQIIKIYNLSAHDIHEEIKYKLRRTEDSIAAAERGSE